MLINYGFYDFLGNIGVFLIIGTYFMLLKEKLNSTSFTYSILNGVGAVLIIISLINRFNFSAFIVECFWLLISIYGIVISLRKKRL